MQFGKYELERKIATGGMAETWLGSFSGAASVTKTVVVKRIRPELANDAEFTRMFINEARIAASLSHGNIAQVFDFGEVDGEYFLAMEFVDGPTLSKVLKRSAAQGLPGLPIPFALYVAMRMCEGLHYAHTRMGSDGKKLSFIHRDVSPQNVIVGFEGEVKLIDFGIAKAAADTRNLTQPGVWKGKLLYASPEQMRIDPLDPRTDVYSTGVMLYEMLCGALPFGGQHASEVLGHIERGEFKRPLLINSDIPKPVEDVVLVAMAPKREDRFPDAHALQEALQRQLYGLAPSFGAATMGQLMAWLYADDLKKRGSSVELPVQFVEQLSMWRKAATSRNTSGVLSPTEGQTVAERSKHKTAAPKYDSLSKTHGDGARPRTVVLAAVTVVLLLAGLFTAGAWVQMSKAQLQVTSVPPGAHVSIGGVPQQGVTPLEVNVTPNEALDVEVTLEGHRPFRDSRIVSSGSRAVLEAKLLPLPPPKPLEPATPPDPIVEPRVPEPPPSARHEAFYPVDTSFELVPAAHGIAVAVLPGVQKIELDPKQRYLVSTDGAFVFSYGWQRGSKGELITINVDTVPYVLEGRAPRFGELGKRPIDVTGATALYVFLIDNGPLQRRGAVHVQVKSTKEKKPRTFALDPRVNSVRLDPEHKLTLRKLDHRVLYKLSLEGGRMMCAQRIAGRPLADPALAASVYRVVEPGTPVTLSRAAELECFLPLVSGEPPPAVRAEIVSLGVPKENLDDAFGELSSLGRVSLQGIGFETGSAKLLPESARVLGAVRDRLERDRALDLVIEGHTDDVGSDTENKKLSQARAEAVLAWLVAHGIAAKRLAAKGYGEERPIADNALDEGRALNRRVDLVRR